MNRRHVIVGVVVFFSAFTLGLAQEFTYSADAPAMFEGDPGSTAEVEAVVQLTSSGIPAGSGVNGWTVSVVAEGGAVTEATTDDTAVTDLSGAGDGFVLNEITSGDGNTGAISAVVLNLTDPTVALIDPTSNVLRLKIESTVPELVVDGNGDAVSVPGELVVKFVDGLQGSGQPVKNRVALSGLSFVPAFEETSVVVASNDSGARPLALNQLAQADGNLELGDDRTLVFDGELEWASARESGSWRGMTFTAAGRGNEAVLLEGVSLFVDSNRDGTFDAADEQVGDTLGVARNNGAVSFSFPARTLDAGNPARFFLVVEAVPNPNAAATLIWPVCLFALLFRLLGRGRPARGRFLAVWVRPLGGTLLCLGLTLPMACSSGGSSNRSREVQFNIVDSDDVDLSGTDSGIRGDLGNLPVEGPAIDV